MASATKTLYDLKYITPPSYVTTNLCYETIMGSEAYGVNRDVSDKDIYGFCIPPKEILFPYLGGEIEGFGTQLKRFEQYQQHHIKKDAVTYDLNIFNIAKYFSLCMQNNPNMIDSLFTRDVHTLYSNNVGKMVIENRKLFLHKGSWHRFKGYAYQQLSKLRTKQPDVTSKRYEAIQKYGYDTKYAYHLVRLINEAEQILVHHDLDLMQNNRQLISIRDGEWSLKQLESWFEYKEKSLEELYVNSSLRKYPDEEAIKQLLLNCLEEHYGTLSNIVINTDKYKNALLEIETFIRNTIKD